MTQCNDIVDKSVIVDRTYIVFVLIPLLVNLHNVHNDFLKHRII